MTRFLFIMPLLIGIQCTQSLQPDKPPNILFYIADDMSPFTDTQQIPAFRQIGESGVNFTNAFTNAPSCTPARGILLTGQHLWDLKEGSTLFGALPADMPVFPLLLKDAGYWVGHTGKAWGPGSLEAGGWKDGENPVGKAYQDEKVLSVRPGMSNVNYASNFGAFLNDRPAETPFFFWYGSFEPHRSFEAGQGIDAGKKTTEAILPASLPDHPEIRKDILDYDIEVEYAAEHLGKMLDLLSERGELENTLVVITSDHGMPFPRAKATGLYDDATRIPLIFSGPGIVGNGRNVYDFVSLKDIGPTLLALAGVQPGLEIKGQSLIPQLSSDKEGWINENRSQIVFALERHTLARPNNVGYPMRAYRTQDYLLIHNYEPDRWPAGDPDFISVHQGIFGDIDAGPTKDFLIENQTDTTIKPYFEWATGKRPEWELYELKTDPNQLQNIAGRSEYVPVLDSLKEVLQSYLEKERDPRAFGHSPWDSNPYYFEDYWQQFPPSDPGKWELKLNY